MDTQSITSRFFEYDDVPRAEVPAAYRHMQAQARSLLEPLVALMEEGRADLEIEGPASDHGTNADRLESFVRPFLLFSHWERSTRVYQEAGDEAILERSKTWFRQALLRGSDPASEQFFGYSANFHQHSVEMGLLVIGLEITRSWLWDGLEAIEREQVISWLESDVGNGHHWNNHMFFGVFLLEFLRREGRDRAAYSGVIDHWFEELEGMYAGEGWYMDGMNQAFDFYNAYAWHYYSLWWIALYGETDTERCQRFRQRTRRFLADYSRFFADSGEHPAFGRSISYRFNATAPFGLAHALHASPISLAQARGVCQRSLDFFLGKPILQRQGCLSLGWYDAFPELAEVYSCGGSPYWAAKGFTPLLISPSDPFWTDAEPSLDGMTTRAVVALRAPSMVVRSVEGEVEILNAGCQIASSNTRFGPHKWGRLSYKTGWGFTLPRRSDSYPFDGGLTAQRKGSAIVYGRHYTAPFALDEKHIGCLYSLGGKPEQFQVSVETRVWWNGNWQLIAHRVVAKDAATLRQGSYALPVEGEVAVEIDEGFPFLSSWSGDRGIALQALCGFDASGFDKRLSSEDGPRRHIQTPFHATALLQATLRANEERLLCSLSWAGKDRAELMPWRLEAMSEGLWELEHPSNGVWRIEDEALPRMQIEDKGSLHELS